MKREDKIDALTSFLLGSSGKLRQLGRPYQQERNLDELSDAELKAIIERGTGKACPDFDAMSDEELQAIINRTTR